MLRNLVLTGVGGRHGIFFEMGGSLDLESITATGFLGRGLRMMAVNAAASLVVRDSVFKANSAGVVVNGSTGGAVRVEIERTRADRNRDNGFLFLGAADESELRLGDRLGRTIGEGLREIVLSV